MKKYLFLWKPFFYTSSLVFSTWLVFTIEKISPSDFGRYKTFFENGPPKAMSVKLLPCSAVPAMQKHTSTNTGETAEHGK